jgi:hypothetical protein
MSESPKITVVPEGQIERSMTYSDSRKRTLAESIHEPGLRRVPDRIPWVVGLIILVELGERFTYFGLSGPLQNYIKYVVFGST